MEILIFFPTRKTLEFFPFVICLILQEKMSFFFPSNYTLCLTCFQHTMILPPSERKRWAEECILLAQVLTLLPSAPRKGVLQGWGA